MTTETRTQHTPGPWQALGNSPGEDLPSVLAQQPNGSGLFYVAQCQNLADARLIAAAPELLAACVSIDDFIPLMQRVTVDIGQAQRFWAAHDLLRAAIAKASGA